MEGELLHCRRNFVCLASRKSTLEGIARSNRVLDMSGIGCHPLVFPAWSELWPLMCGVANHANIAFSLPFNSVQTFHFLKSQYGPKGTNFCYQFSAFLFKVRRTWVFGQSESGRQCGWKPEGAGLQPEALCQAPKGQSSFSLTPILSVASVFLSPAGLYYKRKELIALVDKSKPAQRSETQQNTQGRPYWALITALRPASWGLPVGVKSMN